PLAAIAHDPALLDEPEVMDGVLAAARVALQRDRLQWQLRARLDELERERDFISKVVNAAPTYFCVIDPEGRIVRFNETLIAASGTADDERVRGRPFWEVFPAAGEADAVRGAILAGAADEQQHRWRSASGGELVVAWSLTPLTDAQGRPRLMVTGLDVTHRVAHEDELRRQRDFLRTVGDETPSLIAVVDSEGVVDEAGVNRAFALATGHSDATAIGASVFELVIPPAYRREAVTAFREAVERSQTLKAETPWQSADGTPLLVEWWTASLASWRDGRYLICGIDVTERKQQEVELRRSRSRIVEAQDAERRRLERNLHDGAQQRLVSLSLAIRLAQAKLAGDPHAAEQILAGASAELALALQELRELARGLHPAVLSDRGLAAALGSLAERSLVPVELVIDTDERLPGPVEVGAFYVVSEALANVAKYAHAGAATVRVRREGGAVLVEVIDDGIGGADPSRGSGLRGLVDRVDSLDGRLEVSSPPGGGTRVAAEIPLRPVREAVPQDAG
ncbi:MAG TPA: PAS domain-containing protein, partial [Gaiellaceae bacterium]